jgi:hypothetical protein
MMRQRHDPIMESLMRTTLTIDDDVLAEFKRVAADAHRTLSGVIEDALRAELARRRTAGEVPASDLPVVRGGSMRSGVDLGDSAALLRLLDDGLPFEKLR